MKKDRIIYLLIPAFLVVLNFVVKGLFLGNNSLGGDEQFSVFHAQLSVGGIVHELIQGNNPPLYEIILHFWIKCFGITEFSVRFPSLLFSSITVLFIYKLALRFFNLRVAIYSAVLFVFSTYHVTFAHEARAYALLGMLTAISMYYYLRIIVDKDSSKSIKALCLLLNVLLIYTHFFGFFVLFIQFFFVLLQPKLLKEHYRFLTFSTVVMLAFYLPYLSIIVERFSSSTTSGTWVAAPSGISDLYDMFRKLANAPVGAALTLISLLIGFIVIIAKRKANEHRTATRFLFVWFYFSLFFMFGISFWFPVFLDRYIMFAAIGGTLAIALSVDSIISHPKFRYIIPGLLCLVFIITVKPNKSNNRLERDAVMKVKALKDEGTLVVISPYFFALNFSYYYDRQIFTDVNSKDPFRHLLENLEKEDIICIDNAENIDLSGYNKIILLDVGSSSANNGVYDHLNGSMKTKSKTHIEEIYDVYEFVK